MGGKGQPGPLGGQTNSGSAGEGGRGMPPNAGSVPSTTGSFFAKTADSMASAVEAVAATLQIKAEDLERGIRSDLEGAFCIYAAGIQAEEYAPDAILKETGCQVASVISGFLPGLIQMLEIVGASSVLGAGIGGAVGLFCGGATAVPGLVIGGELGFDVGMAILTALGLGFLVAAISKGFGELYNALHEGVEWAWQAKGLKGEAQKEQQDKAAHKMAEAAGILMRLVLQAIVAELLRRGAIGSTRGALARGKALGNAAAEGTDTAFIAQLRASKFGNAFADWVEKNKGDLEKNPRLQTESAEPEAGRPVASDSASGTSEANGSGSGDNNSSKQASGDSSTGGGTKAGRQRKWKWGSHKSARKAASQMSKRGWTDAQIDEAITGGQQFPAPNNIAAANGATRYVHPVTGRSVVIDNTTNEVLHVGGDGFDY